MPVYPNKSTSHHTPEETERDNNHIMNDSADKADDYFRKVYDNPADGIIIHNKSNDHRYLYKHTVHSVIECVCKYGIAAGQDKHIHKVKKENYRMPEPYFSKHDMYDSNYIVSCAKNQSHKQRIQNNYQLFLNVYFHLSHKPGEKSTFFAGFPTEVINAVKLSNDDKLALFGTETFDFQLFPFNGDGAKLGAHDDGVFRKAFYLFNSGQLHTLSGKNTDILMYC